MKYSNITLHYYTGTGNSFRAAKWFAEKGCQQGALVQLFQIAHGESIPAPVSGSNSLLGLCYPTHAFTAPWSVIKQVLKLPKTENADAFVIQSRAGAYLGPWQTPGLDGTGTWLIALLLRLKGYRVQGLLGLDLPSNWLAVHWGLSPAHVQAMSQRAHNKVNVFADTVLKGEQSVSWSRYLQLLLGIALLPITVMYFMIGRFFLAKLLFPSHRCTHCGLCAQYCPNQAIKMIGSKKPWPYWTWRCESCMRCMGFCPEQAVECSHLLAITIAYIASLPLFYALVQHLIAWIPGLEHSGSHNPAGFALVYVSHLCLFFLAYCLFAALNRIRWVNLVFSKLTLSSVYRRYHEPGTSLKDLPIKQSRV